MGRREYPQRITCAGSGCRETITYRHEFRRDYDAGVRDQQQRPWKCTRCRDEPAWLRPGNEATERAVTATAGPPRGGRDPGLYWREDGKGFSGSGLAHGIGYFADANDFPEGTRLIVTTQIALPEEAAGA